MNALIKPAQRAMGLRDDGIRGPVTTAEVLQAFDEGRVTITPRVPAPVSDMGNPITGDPPPGAINARSLDLIKEFEGFSLSAYQDGGGVWTIGHGTTAMAGLGITPVAGMRITEARANELFLAGVNKFAAEVRKRLTRDPTPNQFGAMVALAYNIGPGGFAKSSVLRRFNAGDIHGAAGSFGLWNKDNGKTVLGLTRRRAAEAALFLSL